MDNYRLYYEHISNETCDLYNISYNVFVLFLETHIKRNIDIHPGVQWTITMVEGVESGFASTASIPYVEGDVRFCEAKRKCFEFPALASRC